MQCNAMQCNAMQCNAMQCNAMQCNAMQCNAMQCNAMQCNAMQCNAMQCNAMQCNAMQCNAMQCNAMQCNAMQCNAMQCNAMQCNAMQCNAMQCNAITQRNAATINQFACSSYSLYVQLLWYPEGMKARVSPVQWSKPHNILAPTQDSNPGGRIQNNKLISDEQRLQNDRGGAIWARWFGWAGGSRGRRGSISLCMICVASRFWAWALDMPQPATHIYTSIWPMLIVWSKFCQQG